MTVLSFDSPSPHSLKRQASEETFTPLTKRTRFYLTPEEERINGLKEMAFQLNEPKRLVDLGLGERESLEMLGRFGRHVRYLNLEGFETKDPISFVERCNNLQFLSLSGHHIGLEGLKRLVEKVRLSLLGTLNLNHTWIGPKGAEVIASTQALSQIKHLSLKGNTIYSQGLTALAQSSFINPEFIDLSFNSIDDDGLLSLPSSRVFQNLREIDLSVNTISEKGALALCSIRSRYFDPKTINLEDNKVKAEALETLTTEGAKKNLSFKLANNPIPAELAAELEEMSLNSERRGARQIEESDPLIRRAIEEAEALSERLRHLREILEADSSEYDSDVSDSESSDSDSVSDGDDLSSIYSDSTSSELDEE